MRFNYQARTEKGEIQVGYVEASSNEAALNILQKYGLYITYLAEVKQPFWMKRLEFLSRVSLKDIIVFTRQFSIMLKSDIPVVESLEAIARQSKKINFQEKILRVAESVEGGKPLSQSLAEFPDLFSAFYIGMIRSGEVTGRLPDSLEYLADYLEREEDFKSKIVASLIYPMFVLFVFVIVLLVMATVVVPPFVEVFTETGMELPFLTRLVIIASEVIRRWWWALGMLGLGMAFALFWFLRSPETRKLIGRYSLKIPFLGSFLKKYYLARLALNLSTLISGGLSISRALEITAKMVGNLAYEQIILATREGVRAGKPMSAILSSYPETFPTLFIQMTVVGEKTGHLEKSLQNVVNFYRKDVDRDLDTFVRMLEPLLIIFLAVLVVLLALSLFVPLFERGLTV